MSGEASTGGTSPIGWDEAAGWYLSMVDDAETGFNDLADRTVLGLVGEVAGLDALDIGCGEGRGARALARAGARVTGVEPTAALLAAARDREAQDGLGVRYLAAGAEDLGTLDDASFDLAVAVLVLHHVDRLDDALREAARVLRPGGRLAVVVPHPWTDHPGARFVAVDGELRRAPGAYGVEGRWHEELDDGATISTVRHVGWHHRTLATWVRSLAAAGFAVTDLVEPTGAEPARADGGGPWRSTPRFLSLVAVSAGS